MIIYGLNIETILVLSVTVEAGRATFKQAAEIKAWLQDANEKPIDCSNNFAGSSTTSSLETSGNLFLVVRKLVSQAVGAVNSINDTPDGIVY